MQHSQEAVDITPNSHPERADRLQNLATVYNDRYKRTGALTDLDLCIRQKQEAVSLTPKGHPHRALRLQFLAEEYRNRYRHSGALPDLELAIPLIQEVSDLTPKDHPLRADQLEVSSVIYRYRYLHSGMLTDLELAIQQNQEAVDLTPEGHSELAARLHNLAAVLLDRYRRTGSLPDLELAIQQIQKAIVLTPKDHPNRGRRLQILAAAYNDRYQQTGLLPDLELAIQQTQDTSDLTPKEQSYVVSYTYDLALSYTGRELSVEVGFVPQQTRGAVDFAPDNHHDQISRLHNLSEGYRGRFQRIGALADLQLSIELGEEAIKLTPEGHPYRPALLQSLATAYHYRYSHSGELADLELSIIQRQEAVNLTPEDHTNRAERLESLSRGYRDRYRRTGVLADLELSIKQIQAASLGLKYYVSRARQLQNLAMGYHDRYLHSGVPADLELAIQKYQKAIDITPRGAPERAHRLRSLAVGYYDRYRRTKDLNDMELFMEWSYDALDHETSDPLERIRAGRDLFDQCVRFDVLDLAFIVASRTLSLIPFLASRSLERSDIQHQVNEIVGLTSDITSVALYMEKPLYEAIQFLEIGRGIIASSLRDMRTDTVNLMQNHPDLAQKFVSFRNRLDSAKNPRKESMEGAMKESVKESRKGSGRYEIAKHLDELIHQIRGLSNFDRFLLSPSEDELRGAAVHGPIVIINVSRHLCDALIIDKEFRTLKLPLLNIKDIQNQADKLASPDIEMLEWLWDAVASPVLTALDFVTVPEHTWPRVWWILTGPLARFPIHAAGRYSENDSQDFPTVMDRVISSYSSSVRAIIDTRRNVSVSANELGQASGEASMVLIGMEQTPGHQPLKFVQEEVDMLAKLGTSMRLQVKQPRSLQEEILSALRGCKIFHFAGHGDTDPNSPSNSALLLSGSRLTVDSVFDINLQQDKPFLAYLSACGTGQIKHKELIDEGIHLISAFQLAGFRHVIGTMWEVNDKSCVDIARMTYEWLQQEGLSDRSVSEGLHHACRKLRSQWIQENATRTASRRAAKCKNETTQEQRRPSQTGTGDPRDITGIEEPPMHWVPYVHYGV